MPRTKTVTLNLTEGEYLTLCVGLAQGVVHLMNDEDLETSTKVAALLQKAVTEKENG